MRPVEFYREDLVRVASGDEFVGLYPEPVLLLVGILEPVARAAFGTSETGKNAGALSSRLSPALLREPTTRVVPVCKSSHNPYRDRIFLGRSPSNDLLINHRSVSKSHLFFEFSEAGAGPRWTLVDLGSRNGTRLGAAPVKPNERVALSDGVLLVAGSCSMYFVAPRSLFDLLQRSA